MHHHPYGPAAGVAIVLPTRADRDAAVLAFVGDRCGRVWLDGPAMAELRRRGLTRGRVTAAIEDLVDAGRLHVRRGLGRVHVQLAPWPPPDDGPPAPPTPPPVRRPARPPVRPARHFR